MLAEYNVLIIGAGNIGALYDSPKSDKVLTHAHAFSTFSGFKLIGFIDTDIQKAKKAAVIWGTNFYNSFEEAFKSHKIDVVCVSVPDEFHYEVLKKLSRYSLKLIFTEKPLTKKIAEADEILNLYKLSKTKIMVNYSRRFVPELETIRVRIESGEFGKFLSGTGYYGKGILHNGSHMIDILSYLMGDIENSITCNGAFDFYNDDPSLSAVIKLPGNRTFSLNHVECSAYTIFEIDILFEKKRLRFIDSCFKIEEYDVIDSDIFKGYRNLSLTKEIKTSLGNAMFFSAQNIYEHLTHGSVLKCTIEEAYKVMSVCMQMKDEFK